MGGKGKTSTEESPAGRETPIAFQTQKSGKIVDSVSLVSRGHLGYGYLKVVSIQTAFKGRRLNEII